MNPHGMPHGTACSLRFSGLGQPGTWSGRQREGPWILHLLWTIYVNLGKLLLFLVSLTEYQR